MFLFDIIPPSAIFKPDNDYVRHQVDQILWWSYPSVDSINN